MKKTILPKAGIFLLLTALSCSEKPVQEDYTALSEEARLEAAKKIAQETIMVDGHVDLPYRMKVGGFTLQREVLDVSERTDGGNFDFPRAKEGGLDAPFMSIYLPARYQQTGGAKTLADSLILMTKRLAETWPEKFAMAYSPDDIEANFKAGKVSLPMGMENGAGIEDDINNVAYFHEKGIRYITLTHGKDNLIGDSSYDTSRTHGGLTTFGEQVVKEMNRVGIMVDISHVSDDTFYDVMELTDVPVIASHSSCRKYTPGFERNMDDEMIKLLGKENGVIMINFGGSFIDGNYNERTAEVREHIVNWLAENELSRTDSTAKAYIEKYVADHNVFPDVSLVADHIDHVVELAGIDHVGFGSDFDGVGDSLPNGLKDVSMYPNLIAELLKRGYSREDVEKICYKNVFRVWRAVEAAAQNS
ncbi:dipeptidase [Echinicola vietnamensis]|uniref:Zn-dependent dipeptidase, microsomal dipeptidase n=1 Tax=Echinicola vietnamensis (strain DSM 17526 / LMG 23754 / KMM 6221) TaxID=926556 RepID=L0FWE8_ECHVK|nr:dipeptidase [Echinicola vietnamensis]AGA77066.1 Zn-dependent dipeptidase, microsomal dipeptidase [Echinicola vietnamensis DSM 17526]